MAPTNFYERFPITRIYNEKDVTETINHVFFVLIR